MISPERGLPSTFDPSTGQNVKWSVELGTETHSTPAVAGGRVLIGTNNGNPRDPRHTGDRGILMCFDEQDGRFRWQLVVPKLSKDIYQDWPRAGIVGSPVIDGRRVYILDNRVEMLCLDLDGQSNGNDGPFLDEASFQAPLDAPPIPVNEITADILWTFPVLTQTGSYPHDSAHTAPLLDGSTLYFNTCNGVDNTHRKIRAPDAPSLIALDALTGRWLARDDERIGPVIFHSTWSSPALGEVNGRKLVIFGGGDGVVYAFRALPGSAAAPAPPVQTLQKVWWFDGDPDAPKSDVHRFTGNRRESPSNIKSIPVFHRGRVYVTLGGDVWWGKNQAWLKCIDATASGDITRTGEVWSYPLQNHCMVTPAVHDERVYVADSGRRAHCVNARTGQAHWTHDLDAEVWASPLVADGKVYFASRRGTVWCFADAPEMRILGQVKLGEPINASPIAANGVLYLATMTRLYALQDGAQGKPLAP